MVVIGKKEKRAHSDSAGTSALSDGPRRSRSSVTLDPLPFSTRGSGNARRTNITAKCPPPACATRESRRGLPPRSTGRSSAMRTTTLRWMALLFLAGPRWAGTGGAGARVAALSFDAAPIVNPPPPPPERFAVAPMMAHTHRHYRFYYRLISQHAWLVRTTTATTTTQPQPLPHHNHHPTTQPPHTTTTNRRCHHHTNLDHHCHRPRR